VRLGFGTPIDTVRGNLRHPPTVDRWCFSLSCLIQTGDDAYAWRTAHDEVLHIIAQDAMRAGITGTQEAGGLFADLLPQAARGKVMRDGLRPDLKLTIDGRQLIYDLKLVRFIEPYYVRNRVLRAQGVAGPVDYRAQQVKTEYAAGSREVGRAILRSRTRPGRSPAHPAPQQLPAGSGACIRRVRRCVAGGPHPAQGVRAFRRFQALAAGRRSITSVRGIRNDVGIQAPLGCHRSPPPGAPRAVASTIRQRGAHASPEPQPECGGLRPCQPL
jgi:hypothetical protein